MHVIAMPGIGTGARNVAEALEGETREGPGGRRRKVPPPEVGQISACEGDWSPALLLRPTPRNGVPVTVTVKDGGHCTEIAWQLLFKEKCLV